MGLHAFEEVRRGRLRWEEWLPDGLHPTHRGSLSYGQSVNHFLQHELVTYPPSDEMIASKPKALKPPLEPLHWGNSYILPFHAVELEGPWTIRRSVHLVWMDQILDTAAIGARLKFSFIGRGVVLGFDFGKSSAEFRYRLDGGNWSVVERDRPDWCGDSGWFRPYTVVDDLPEGEHTMEIEVIHGNRPDCRGTNFRLALIGILTSPASLE